MDKLTNTNVGVWFVHTESGTVYRVSLNDAQGQNTIFKGKLSPELVKPKQDVKEFNLVSIVTCEVGVNAVFMLTGASEHDSVVTGWRTSPVVSITAVTD